MMAEKILLEVEFDSARAEQRATQLRKTVADLATQRKQLNNAIKENQKEEARLTQAIAAQQSALKGLIASGKQNTQEYENASKELRSLQSRAEQTGKAPTLRVTWHSDGKGISNSHYQQRKLV